MTRGNTEPPRPAVDALGVSYRNTVGNWRSMHPDFVFFTRSAARSRFRSSTPRHHLEDSLIKLQALARFAAECGEDFHRIEALAKIGSEMRVLDLQRVSAAALR